MLSVTSQEEKYLWQTSSPHGPDTGQVNLSALPTVLPVLNTFVNFLLDLKVN